MQINIFTLTSPIHNHKEIEAVTKEWLGAIQEVLGKDVLNICHEQYGLIGCADLDLIYVRTGGTEGLFRKLYTENEKLRGKKIYLLTSGKSNSLAASIEILSWLHLNGAEGEILHGDAPFIAKRIILLAKVNMALKQLQNQKIGIIGKPSDWLIASDYNSDILRQKIGVQIEEITIDELLQEFRRHDYPISARKRLQTCPSDYFIGALEVYGSLRRIVDKHHLSALTLRCFDLLSTIKNTGCLALALLNQEGIPSSCEGDVPARLTMMISQALTGHTGFQANPSRINPETDECIFAHCTIPLNMISKYEYDTHFESGIGVAIKGKMPTGIVTLAKVNGDLTRFYAAEGILEENLNEANLCRTQVKIKVPGAAKYFLYNPIGNHHIILQGSQRELINIFMQSL